MSVEGDGAGEVETLVRRVAYGDARAFPTPGRRNVHLDTTITCVSIASHRTTNTSYYHSIH